MKYMMCAWGYNIVWTS